MGARRSRRLSHPAGHWAHLRRHVLVRACERRQCHGLLTDAWPAECPVHARPRMWPDPCNRASAGRLAWTDTTIRPGTQQAALACEQGLRVRLLRGPGAQLLTREQAGPQTGFTRLARQAGSGLWLPAPRQPHVCHLGGAPCRPAALSRPWHTSFWVSTARAGLCSVRLACCSRPLREEGAAGTSERHSWGSGSGGPGATAAAGRAGAHSRPAARCWASGRGAGWAAQPPPGPAGD